MATGSIDCEVLIVGGGPTGLTLGLALAQRSISVIIVEKEAGPYPLPRAAQIDHQVVRIFQDIGLAESILADCRTVSGYEFRTAEGEVLVKVDGWDRIGSGGWPLANMIHQPSIERVLRDAVASTAGVELRDSWTLTGLDEHHSDVEARFDTNEGEQRLHARYLIGADGARSPVRSALGINLDDLGFDEQWIVIDMIVKDATRLPLIGLQICDPDRPTTVVPMGAGRHRWEFMVKPGEVAEEVAEDTNIARMLKSWDVEGAIEIERKAFYRFNAMIASHWRQDRVLLAGDAAHRMPPFAGQGMCAGIRDAANLAWKLADVLRGRAPDTLLDTYQTEREPNVRYITGTAITAGEMICITDPVAAAARNERMVAARKAGETPLGPPDHAPYDTGFIMAGSPGAGTYFPQLVADDGSRLDDAMGRGAWLITRNRTDFGVGTAGITANSIDDAALSSFATELSGWFDLSGAGADAVLVRPDRHVFGTGSSDWLRSAWGKVGDIG